MRIPLLISFVFVACADPTETVSRARQGSAPASHGRTEQPGIDRVAVTPSEASRQVGPGVFVETLRPPNTSAPSIEALAGFVVVETVYDERGAEVATSVPSTRWSLLPASARVWMAGMRSGEGRRIWTCADSAASRCKVEDVFVYSDPRAVGTQ